MTDLFARSADVYDLVYAAKGKDYVREADAVRRLIETHARRSPVETLIDFACGTGEHLAHLRSSFTVTGIDHSPAMLDVARRKLPGVELHQGGLETIDLGRTFDAGTCLFASIAYLPDEAALRNAVANMARHLAPGGVLVIEPGVTPDRLAPPVESTLEATGQDVRVTRRTRARHDADALVITFDYDVRRRDTRDRFTETHRIALFDEATYHDAVTHAGLQVIEAFTPSHPWLIATKP